MLPDFYTFINAISTSELCEEIPFGSVQAGSFDIGFCSGRTYNKKYSYPFLLGIRCYSLGIWSFIFIRRSRCLNFNNSYYFPPSRTFTFFLAVHCLCVKAPFNSNFFIAVYPGSFVPSLVFGASSIGVFIHQRPLITVLGNSVEGSVSNIVSTIRF